jgi:hypothetical protein
MNIQNPSICDYIYKQHIGRMTWKKTHWKDDLQKKLMGKMRISMTWFEKKEENIIRCVVSMPSTSNKAEEVKLNCTSHYIRTTISCSSIRLKTCTCLCTGCKILLKKLKQKKISFQMINTNQNYDHLWTSANHASLKHRYRNSSKHSLQGMNHNHEISESHNQTWTALQYIIHTITSDSSVKPLRSFL